MPERIAAASVRLWSIASATGTPCRSTFAEEPLPEHSRPSEGRSPEAQARSQARPQTTECRAGAETEIARRAQQEKGCTHHGGGEGNVFRVIEHAAIPDPANRKSDGGDKSGARPGDHAARRPGCDDAPDSRQGAEDVTNVIEVEWQQV